MDGWIPPPSSLPPPLKKNLQKIYNYFQLSAAPSAIERKITKTWGGSFSRNDWLDISIILPSASTQKYPQKIYNSPAQRGAIRYRNWVRHNQTIISGANPQ
jgi:hypothetical protein